MPSRCPAPWGPKGERERQARERQPRPCHCTRGSTTGTQGQGWVVRGQQGRRPCRGAIYGKEFSRLRRIISRKGLGRPSGRPKGTCKCKEVQRAAESSRVGRMPLQPSAFGVSGWSSGVRALRPEDGEARGASGPRLLQRRTSCVSSPSLKLLIRETLSEAGGAERAALVQNSTPRLSFHAHSRLQRPHGLNSGSSSMSLLPAAPPLTWDFGLNRLHPPMHPVPSPRAMPLPPCPFGLLRSPPRRTRCVARAALS